MTEIPESPRKCGHCGTELSPAFLSCPSCGHLVHSDALKRVVASAKDLDTQGKLSESRDCWREALELVPPDSRQYAYFSKSISDLTSKLESMGVKDTPGTPKDPKISHRRHMSKSGWALIVASLVGLVSKGKFVALGLTKATTFFSMLLSLGVYWNVWGWKLAAGLIVCIYIHEMGHLAMMRYLGIKASAPMFLPGIGAYVQAKQKISSVVEDARVGLIGPMWGLLVTVLAYALHLATKNSFWGALAHTNAWINLLNLLPIWQLDGARGFRAINRGHRFLLLLMVIGLWAWTREGLLMMLGIITAGRLLFELGPKDVENRSFIQYAILLLALTAFAFLKVDPITQIPSSIK